MIVNYTAKICKPVPKTSSMKVFLAIPAYGNLICNATVISILRLQMLCIERNVQLALETLGNESLVQRARNILTKKFLLSDSDVMLFIDADIGFDPMSVMRMLDAGKDIATAIYPKKGIDWDLVQQKMRDGDDEPLYQAGLEFNMNLKDVARVAVRDGWVEVLDAATGFMMISRSAMQRMVEAHADELYCVNDVNQGPGDPVKNYVAVWDCMIDPVSKRYLSEDFSFNRRAQALGIETYACVVTPLMHVGNQLFSGDLMKRYNIPEFEPATFTPSIVEVHDAGQPAEEKMDRLAEDKIDDGPPDPSESGSEHPQGRPPHVEVASHHKQCLLALVSENKKECCLAFLWSLLRLQLELIRHQCGTALTVFGDVNSALNEAYSEKFEKVAVLNSMVAFDPTFVLEAVLSDKHVIVGGLPMPEIDWTRVREVPVDDPEPMAMRGLKYNVDIEPIALRKSPYVIPKEVRWMPVFVISRDALENVARKTRHSTGHLFWADDIRDGVMRPAHERLLEQAEYPAFVDVVHMNSSFGPLVFGGVLSHRIRLIP